MIALYPTTIAVSDPSLPVEKLQVLWVLFMDVAYQEMAFFFSYLEDKKTAFILSVLETYPFQG